MKIKDIPWQDLDTPRKLLLQRLLLHTTENANECWMWNGAVAQSGEGHPHATINTERGPRQIGLNRVAWHIFHDMPLLGSKHIQVSRNSEICDEQRCWNPEHFESIDLDYD